MTQPMPLQAFKWAGSVSHGALDEEDLLTAFWEVLQDLAPDRIDRQVIERERRAYCAFSGTYDHDPEYGADDVARELNDAQRFLTWLRDQLGELAPPGYYFGRTDGPELEYGFWPIRPVTSQYLDRLLDPYVRALHVTVQGDCPITGTPLNAGTAVIVQDAQGRVAMVVSPEGWESQREDLLTLLPGATVKKAS